MVGRAPPSDRRREDALVRQRNSEGGNPMQRFSMRRTVVVLGAVAALAVGTGLLLGAPSSTSTAQAAELDQRGGPGPGGPGPGGPGPSAPGPGGHGGNPVPPPPPRHPVPVPPPPPPVVVPVPVPPAIEVVPVPVPVPPAIQIAPVV